MFLANVQVSIQTLNSNQADDWQIMIIFGHAAYANVPVDMTVTNSPWVTAGLIHKSIGPAVPSSVVPASLNPYIV